MCIAADFINPSYLVVFPHDCIYLEKRGSTGVTESQTAEAPVLLHGRHLRIMSVRVRVRFALRTYGHCITHQDGEHLVVASVALSFIEGFQGVSKEQTYKECQVTYLREPMCC